MVLLDEGSWGGCAELEQVLCIITAHALAAPGRPAALRGPGAAGRPRNLRSPRPWLRKGRVEGARLAGGRLAVREGARENVPLDHQVGRAGTLCPRRGSLS